MQAQGEVMVASGVSRYFACAEVLLEAHDIRLAHGDYNIADEYLADAIEPPSRKPAAAGKK